MEIKSRFDHFNFNVLDLERSIRFYDEALGLKEVKRINAEDGSYILVYLGDGGSPFSLELTWLRDWDKSYDLGDVEFHLCMRVQGDYEQIKQYHKEREWVVFENEKMGLYFIEDPDGYWVEVLPAS